MTNTSPTEDFASDILYGFDIRDEESFDFLKSVIISGQTPASELRELHNLSLLRGKEEWDMVCACAEAVHARSVRGVPEKDPGVVPYLAWVCAGREGRERVLAGLEEKKEGKKRGPRRATSKFWEDTKEGKGEAGRVPHRRDGGVVVKRGGSVGDDIPVDILHQPDDEDPSSLLETITPSPTDTIKPEPNQDWDWDSPTSPTHHHAHTPRSRPYKASPFFSKPPTPRKPRPPRGTISSLPIPSLSAPRFGLIQEALSHDSFRLLVAVTFLIRTTGKAAIPVFHAVMERFPTPKAFVEGDSDSELVPMIRQLGLAGVRVAAIGRYAGGWVGEGRPVAGRGWMVRGYPRREGGVLEGCGELKQEGGGGLDEGGERGVEVGAELPEEPRAERLEGGELDDAPAEEVETPKRKSKLPSSEWEIGHLTQGPYAIDSWRIFCRDIFLGKSENWMGREGDETFEPEWKRVLPDDKELRACLRWMWMREGYEWDPLTGKKSPLRDEMRDAVNEGRVGYDDMGSLIILDCPLGGEKSG